MPTGLHHPHSSAAQFWWESMSLKCRISDEITVVTVGAKEKILMRQFVKDWICCISDQFRVYNHALYCELLAPTLCPQRPNYILVQKEQLSTLQNFTQHTQEGGMARKVSVESLSTWGSEHFGRPVTIHTQCRLPLSMLKRDRKVAGHIENRRLFICHQE